MRVLITGSSRGLGYALAEIYAENGCEVLATARSCRESDQLVKLAGRYPKIRLFDMDVASWPSIRTCAEDIRKFYDSIDLVINNAGVLYENDKVNREAAAGIYEMSTGQRKIKN